MEKVRAKFIALINLPCSSIELLNGGLTNTNYLINNSYVLRMRKPFSIPGLDASLEKDIENKLKEKSFMVPILAYDATDGTKITKYLSEARVFSAANACQNDYQRIALLLFDLHHSSINVSKKMDIPKRIEEYKNAYPTHDLYDEKAIINTAKKWLDTAELTLCHNDVVPGNILLEHDHIYLIDYEYAMMNDPFFDLVSFLSENDIIDEQLQKEFLSYYYGNYAPWMKTKVNDYFHLLDLLWFHWAKMMYHFEKEEIYLEIANIKGKRLQSFLK